MLINFDHLVKLVYAKYFSLKLAFFPFVITQYLIVRYLETITPIPHHIFIH